MRAYHLIIALLISVSQVYAHSGTDELRDLEKNKLKIFSLQKNFKDMDDTTERIDSLASQLVLLQRNIKILREKMMEESTRIKSSICSYQLDYLAEADYLLKEFSRTLKQTKKVLAKQ